MFFSDNNWLHGGEAESEGGSMPSSQFWQQQLIPIDQDNQQNEPETIEQFLTHATTPATSEEPPSAYQE